MRDITGRELSRLSESQLKWWMTHRWRINNIIYNVIPMTKCALMALDTLYIYTRQRERTGLLSKHRNDGEEENTWQFGWLHASVHANASPRQKDGTQQREQLVHSPKKGKGIRASMWSPRDASVCVRFIGAGLSEPDTLTYPLSA